MTKLDRLLPKLYRIMHGQRAFTGNMWERHRAEVSAFFGPTAYPVLDFGCGPAGGLAAMLGPNAISYDPYVPAFAADPWAAGPRGFFSCDVLEHLTVDNLRQLVDRLVAAPGMSAVLVSVSTRAANKVMPNGLNAHLTVRGHDWWDGFFDYQLGRVFTRTVGRYDLARAECVLGYRRRASS